MRPWILVPVFVLCSAAFAGEIPVSPSPPPPSLDSRIIGRIERACDIGVGKAESEEEVLLNLRWRNGSLLAIVEITYQATLAWLSEIPARAESMETEQGKWLAGYDALPKKTREELETAAARLRHRLGALMAVTEGESPLPRQ